jgi:hypothetical protein
VTSRRQFTLAVVACAAAAGIALFAASRTWLVEVTARPDPLPALTTLRTGGSLVPLLPALALVGLAGAGGLMATRGRARVAVAVLIALVGLGIPASLYGVVARPGVTVGWVVVAMVAGLAVAGVGALAIRRGGSWPTMGSRYELAAPPVAIRQTNTAGANTAGADTGGADTTGADSAGADTTGADTASDGTYRDIEHGHGGHGQAIDAGGRGGGGNSRVAARPDGRTATAGRMAATSRTDGVDLGGAGLWDALDRGEDPTKG